MDGPKSHNYISSPSLTHLHTIPANQVLCKSNMLSQEIMHPLAFKLFKLPPHLCWLSSPPGACSAPLLLILHRENRRTPALNWWTWLLVLAGWLLEQYFTLVQQLTSLASKPSQMFRSNQLLWGSSVTSKEVRSSNREGECHVVLDISVVKKSSYKIGFK